MKTTFTLLVLIISINIFAQVPKYVPTDGVVGFWPLDGNADDESGNGLNGTVTSEVLTSDRKGPVLPGYYLICTLVYLIQIF